MPHEHRVESIVVPGRPRGRDPRHRPYAEARSARRGGVRIGLLADGPLLPSGEGATQRFIETARCLHDQGVDVTIIHAFRGWSDWRVLARQPFRVVLVHPSDYYGTTRVLEQLQQRFRFDWLQSKDPEVISSLVERGVVGEGPGLVYECHDLPEAEPGQVLPQQIAAGLADRVVCVNEHEARRLRGAEGPGRVVAIPCTLPRSAVVPRRHYGQGRRLAFLGNYYYGPNQEAAIRLIQEVMPELRRHVPDAELHLYGDAPSELRTLGAEVGCRWFGYVDDVVTSIKRCDVALSVVFRGTGFRVKLLHYMAAGLPVVANELGVGGVGARGCFRMSEQLPELIEHCVELLGSPHERNRLATEASAVLEEDFSSERVAADHRQCLEAPPRGRPCRFRERMDSMSAASPAHREALGAQARRTPSWLEEVIERRRYRGVSTTEPAPGRGLDLHDSEHLAALEALRPTAARPTSALATRP
ncbi:MAG: glycosyltransferase family 4 protein [Deltaproteobacteria bacterium]|nr:glycosyltransferase family 4 protein [Deltaproteobacteria bacterium]